MKVCRICLSKEGRLYHIASNGLCSLYYQLTGVPKLEADVAMKLPPWVCAECGLRLLSYNKLRQKSLRAYKILSQFLNKGDHITEEHINQIDRNKHDLESNLTYAVVGNGTVQDYVLDIQEINETDKPDVKTDEFVMDIELAETEMDIQFVETEIKLEDYDSCPDFISETVIDEKNNLKSDNEGSDNLNFVVDPSDTESFCKEEYLELDSDDSSNSSLLEIKSNAKLVSKSAKITVVKRKTSKKEVVQKKVKNTEDLFPLEELFTVKTLSMKEQIADMEKRQHSASYIGAPYKCVECYQGFDSGIVFARHQLRHSDESGKFKCKLCKQRFPNKPWLMRHLKMHRTIYSCKQCDFIATERLPATRHGLKHKVHDDQSRIKLATDEALASHESISQPRTRNQVAQNNPLSDDESFSNAEYVENDDSSSSSLLETKSNAKLVAKSAKKTVVRRKRSKKGDVKNTEDPFPLEDLFTLKILSMEEQLADMEKRQYSKSYIASPYKCTDCFKGFLTQKFHARHQLRHSDASGNMECPLCKQKFFKPRMTTHMRRHSTAYNCKLCNFVAHERYVAISHGLIKHKGHTYECPHCDKKFNNRSTYFFHVRVKHISKFVCEFCGYAFSSDKGVYLHKSLAHGGNKNKITVPKDGPTCSSCNIKFATNDALATHEGISHPQIPGESNRNELIKVYDCEICGYQTKDHKAFAMHYRNHLEVGGAHPIRSSAHKSRLINLDLEEKKCSEGAATWQKFHQPVVCVPCGREFKNEITLAKHAVVHSGIKPYQCKECDRKFAVKKAVKIHMIKVHMPKKPTQPKTRKPQTKSLCNVCGKEFPTVGKMNLHLARHSEQRPFPCEVCGKYFKTNSDVDAHYVHVHLKTPWPRSRKSKARDT